MAGQGNITNKDWIPKETNVTFLDIDVSINILFSNSAKILFLK